jgi:MYXO-CTERM domain-containing protein
MAGSLVGRDADAYCRTAVCANGASGQRCTPAQQGDCGTPLRWAQGCFGYSVQEKASKSVSLATTQQILSSAFAAWTTADCGGGKKPGIKVSSLGTVVCNQKEYNQKGGNANLVVYRDDKWPYTGAGNTLALTTVTYNLDDGSIYDADLEINGTVELTVTPTEKGAKFDLQSIVTHEAGHMLGLAHSDKTDATMFVQYLPGEIKLRTLDPDDAAAICAAYPSANVDACDPTPRRGLASECDSVSASDEGGCNCNTVGRSERQPGWLAAFMLGAIALARTRRRR